MEEQAEECPPECSRGYLGFEYAPHHMEFMPGDLTESVSWRHSQRQI